MQVVLPYPGGILNNLTEHQCFILEHYKINRHELMDMSIRLWHYMESVRCTGTEDTALAFEHLEDVIEIYGITTYDDYVSLVEISLQVAKEMSLYMSLFFHGEILNNDIGVTTVFGNDPLVEVYY